MTSQLTVQSGTLGPQQLCTALRGQDSILVTLLHATNFFPYMAGEQLGTACEPALQRSSRGGESPLRSCSRALQSLRSAA